MLAIQTAILEHCSSNLSVDRLVLDAPALWLGRVIARTRARRLMEAQVHKMRLAANRI